jgi:hypothetical protein
MTTIIGKRKYVLIKWFCSVCKSMALLPPDQARQKKLCIDCAKEKERARLQAIKKDGKK